ncbi:Bax inhibitor-1/YccA family protein [Sphingorhabdus sp. EL138]|jgi:FtsH-binding integral membrane protein|uniref:Bax inhibitor-1/YccA family protein n=1 Tax=Sphingorhabdus sp. EL138 TaxID=2073156 RepID=UPI0025DB7708|nr:Bax inhibitor-1/YccA family protein [Sphingorhabdus sp. EL138]
MAQWSDPRVTGTQSSLAGVGSRAGDVAFDAGLRSHMLKVYNYMASGVLLTGIVAMLFASSAFGQNLMINGGALRWVIILSPLALILVMNFGLNKLSTGALQACFWAFAGLMGLSMSTIFLVYTGASIATTFFATAAAFAGLSLVGYTTKKDLSGMGTFLIMGVVGLLVASLANIWFQSSTLQWVVSAAGVLIFAGLTVYDTQMIKNTYLQLRSSNSDFIGKAAIMGALTLYLDFINMFQFLLSFLGNRE